jgi:cobalt-zinc-cadmium resistance protein CzcA
MRSAYAHAVGWLIGHRLAVAGAVVVLLAATGIVASRLGSEFLPELDEGDLVIFVEMPPSIALDRGTEVLTEVRRRLLQFPEVLETMSEQGRPEDGTDDEGVNMSETFVHIAPREQWRRGWDKDRLIEAMRASLTEIPGVSYNFSQPIKDNVEGSRQRCARPGGAEGLRHGSRRDEDHAREVCCLADQSVRRCRSRPLPRRNHSAVADRARPRRPGTRRNQRRRRSGRGAHGARRRRTHGVLAERAAGPVRVIFPLPEREDEERIGNILVRAADGGHVPLREVARIDKAMGKAAINRESNSRVLALKFNIEGRDMGSVVADAMAAVKRDVSVPEGNFLVWGGEFENQKRALARLAIIVPFSFLVVFALLYTALGSVASASAVLLVAPLAMSGGVFGLAFAHIPLSVSAAVGFIALLGQVCLASLLVVSAVDDRRRRGEEMLPALSHGAATRFRAVLMTAMLAILGLTPMAISTGVGSETQRPFAVVIISGLFTAVAVTLFVLPTVYSLVVRRIPALEAAED